MTEPSVNESEWRVPAGGGDERPGRRRKAPNPYTFTLAVIWIGALAVGLLFVASSASAGIGIGAGPDAVNGPALAGIGTVLLIIGGAAGLVHLGVKAVLWRERP